MKNSFKLPILGIILGLIDLYYGLLPFINPAQALFSIFSIWLIISGLAFIIASILGFKRSA